MQMRGAVVAAIATVMLAGCGGSGATDDYCALADLPARTPAEVDVIRQQATRVIDAHKGQVAAGTDRNRRIFRAVISVAQSADHAHFLAGASASGLASLASDVFKDFGKGSGFTVTDLPKAQSELRAACRG